MNATQQIFSLGMLPLWICSFVLAALIFNRFRALRRTRVLDPAKLERVVARIEALDYPGAEREAASSNTVVLSAWTKGLRQFQLGGILLEEALANATSVALKPLKRNINHMATIGVIAPMIGLIGTVVGMIMTFSALAQTGETDKTKLAAGLAFALYKTAGGLIVAIPAIVAGRFFTGKVTAYAAEAEAAILSAHYAQRHGISGGAPTSGRGPAPSQESGAPGTTPALATA